LGLNGGTYTLTRLSDGAQWSDTDINTLSDTVSASEGFSFDGTMASGDSFVIQPTRHAAGDIEVNTAIAENVNLVAAASPIKTLAGTISSSNVVTNNNKGTASISAGSVETGYSAPASGSPVTLAYDSSTTGLTGFPTGTTVTVTNAGTTSTYVYDPTGTTTGSVTSVPYKSGATISFSGISFEITGTPSDDDKFTVARNSSGTSDGRNALALGNLQTAKTMAGNKASYESAYAQLVSDIGNKTREVSVTETAQQSLLDQATSASQSLSGVNLDEEAANLLKYQEAYQASAKVISTASTLFDTILAINA